MARRTRKKPGSTQYCINLANRLNAVTGGVSLREAAKATGYNHETIRRYCNKGKCPADFLVAAAYAFGVSPGWLLTGPGAKGGQRRRVA